ncbi:uncharacterized protein LOC132735758 isoform X2 [Ruditapes philippinarum]|uniref:uncharacterized protein LOC132735758 isoform X2 n=1 Tax=Ruditapes philippinarum TaxID=129788 RepID=UPI00295B4E0B|nr:uncharacterized protein LOC132735758 isoform X2 [Ruditapes philippinarum]
MCTAADSFQQDLVEKKVLEYRTQLCRVINAPNVLRWMPGFLSTEYPYLVSLLVSNQTPEQCNHQKKILQIFAPYLELQIEPCDLITHFFSSNLINKSDMEEIQACQRSRGSVAATILMLDCIQRRQAPSKWYTGFLKILYQKGFKDIVHEMEPEFSLDCEILKIPKLLVTDTSDSDIDTDEYGCSIEEKIEAKVRYFQSEITELLSVEKIAPALCQLISLGKICRIMQDQFSSKKESIDSLIEEIIKLRSKTKWRTFICCLKESDYPHLAELLSKPRTNKCQSKEKAVLRLFQPVLGEQLEPIDLISHLEKDNAINHRDKEEVLKTLHQSGKTAASLVLIDCVQCRLAPAQWYSAFLKALHACNRDDLVEIIDPEYFKKYMYDSSEVEKESDVNEVIPQEAINLDERIDAAHCHIYNLEKSAKQEVVKLQKHFDALKKSMFEQIENKSFALTKNLENMTERTQDAGLRQEFETCLKRVMSTSYTLCDVDSFTKLTKLGVLQESYNTSPIKHTSDRKQNTIENKTKPVASIFQGTTANRRRRCFSESSSGSSSSSSYLFVTNPTQLSTSSDSLAIEEDSRVNHVSKVRFADDNEMLHEKHKKNQNQQKIDSNSDYLSQYGTKKTCRKRNFSESSVFSTDASIVSSTDRPPSSSLTDSLTGTSSLSSSTKTASVTEKKVLIERRESYIFHHEKVVNCKTNCVLSSVCCLPNNKTVLVDQCNCSFHIYGRSNICEKLKSPRFKNYIPICLCSIGENHLYILFRTRDCTNVLVQCNLHASDVVFVKTVAMSAKCNGKLCSVASGNNNVVAFCIDKHMHVFSKDGIETKIVSCDIKNENEWWPNYSVVDSRCEFGFTYDIYSNSVYCFCISTGEMVWRKKLPNVEGITLCDESIYLSMNVSYAIEVLSKTTGDYERSITENVRRPFAMSRSHGHDTIIVTQYHPEGKKINRTIKYF